MINVVKRWLRPVARKAEAAILMYHRIGDPGCDPWGLAVRPERFAEHLNVLRRNARPIGLRRLAKELGEGTLKPGAVAVTFDDGYANNLYEAKPLLERHEVPATVFVTSGMVGREREFWWDELEAILLASRELPQTLRLEIEGQTHEWGPIEFARGYSETMPKPSGTRTLEMSAAPSTGCISLGVGKTQAAQPVDQGKGA